MHELTDEGRRLVEETAARHGVSFDAAASLLQSLVNGGGTQAQFSHPELGGMGQWSSGGMIMIGDMFNNGLKYRVDALLNDLSGLLRSTSLFQSAAPMPSSGREGVSLFVPGGGFSASAWPESLGSPRSSGSQNDLHYAYFPDTRRLAIRKGGHITVYDTGDHAFGGFSQQQGNDQSLTFTSQFGHVRVADLPVVPATGEGEPKVQEEPTPAALKTETVAEPDPLPEPSKPGASHDEIFAKIERLAELHAKGVLNEDEFQTKKTELLSRL